jgi:hypothetical protein
VSVEGHVVPSGVIPDAVLSHVLTTFIRSSRVLIEVDLLLDSNDSPMLVG